MEGFGYSDWNNKTPVTKDTLFSIQSMSKSFTATAAMFAIQDGLVDLDAPISDYLPDFHVNSIFEDNPEQKMTLRDLLSHTAGFAHEAPYGGNYDFPEYSFEKHITSISDTWLRFPVGIYWGYSNLGIDLAGYILQVRSGMPFIQYTQEKVLQPLGMKHSTLDVQLVRADTSRAIGHYSEPFPPPVDFLIIPSGGVWTTAEDMTRYLQFHINKGKVDGRLLLQEGLVETMYTPPNTVAQIVNYGLGINLSTRNGARHFQHGGGGMGFTSSMVWYPDLKLGSVVLTNAEPSIMYAYNLSEEVLDRIIAKSPEVYTQRAENSSPLRPTYPPIAGENPLTTFQLTNLIASKALPENATAASQRSIYSGKYIIQINGIPNDTVEVSDFEGVLSVTYLGEVAKMTEVEPGLFFSPTGVVLDLRGSDLMFNNMHLIKAKTQTLMFRGVFFSTCGILFISTVLFWPIRALVRGVRQKKSAADTHVQTRGRQLTAFAGITAGIACLFSLFCLVMVFIIPNLVYLPWPPPHSDLNLWQHLLFYLPYISIVLTGMATLFACSCVQKPFSLEWLIRLYFLVVILVLISFNIALLI